MLGQLLRGLLRGRHINHIACTPINVGLTCPVCNGMEPFQGGRGAFLYDDKNIIRHWICNACYGKVIIQPLISTNEAAKVFSLEFDKFIYPICNICGHRAYANMLSNFPSMKQHRNICSIIKRIGYIDKTTVIQLSLCSDHIKPWLSPSNVIDYIKRGVAER